MLFQLITLFYFFIQIQCQANNKDTIIIAERNIVTKGNYFFNQKDESRFFFKGLVYQHRFEQDLDPLALDRNLCEYYANFTQSMGVNTVLVYSVESKKDHSECMNILNNHNIQVLLGVGNIASEGEKYGSIYGVDDYNNIETIVKEFLKYPNLIGFITGFESKELLNSENRTQISLPVTKAIVRDVKKLINDYVKASNQQVKNLPLVGISMHSQVQGNMNTYTDYFTCPSDTSVKPDFISFSSFDICDKLKLPNGMDLNSSPWKEFPIPMFFSEIGCDTGTPQFNMFDELSNSPVVERFSGGFIYELKDGNNKSGVIIHVNADLTLKPSYFELMTAWDSFPPKDSTKLSTYKANIKDTSCDNNIKIQPAPKPNKKVCECLDNQVPCSAITEQTTQQEAYKNFIQLCKNKEFCNEVRNFPDGKYSQCSLNSMISWTSSQISLANKNTTEFDGVLSCSTGSTLKKVNSLPLPYDKCSLYAKPDYKPPPLVLNVGQKMDYMLNSSSIINKMFSNFVIVFLSLSILL